MNKLLLAITLLSYAYLGIAQEDCGTVVTAKDREFSQRLNKYITDQQKARSSSNVAYVQVPLKFHFVVENEGDLGMPDTQADQLIQELNDIYRPASIGFFHVGEYNRIVDPDNYNFNSPNEGAVAVGNEVRNAVNIFFFGSARSGGTPVCGYAYLPSARIDRIIMAYGCSGVGNATLEHELGHYFNLLHTHGRSNATLTNEFVDGSNCASAGDDVCDTPADPNLSGQVSNCVYTGNQTDAKGMIFQPDPSNIMAYSPDQCQDYFSPQQFQRIRAAFETGRNYLDFITDDVIVTFSQSSTEVCLGETVRFSADGFGVSEWQWEFEGGIPSTSTERNPTVTYNEGGVFNVKLIGRDNAGEEAVLEIADLIEVDDPLSRVVDQELIEGFENVILTEKYRLKNPDNFITFDVSSVDVSGAQGASMYVDNYNYEAIAFPQIDFIEFDPVQTIGLKGIKLSFDVSYRGRTKVIEGSESVVIFDSLAINTKSGCSEDMVRFAEFSGSELVSIDPVNLTPTTIPEEYVPGSAQDWKKIEIDYPIDNDGEFVVFSLENISYNGNNLYIDDLKIIPDYSLDAPTALVSTVNNQGFLSLTWTDNSVNELGFVIERSTNEDAFEIIGEATANAVNYVDQTVENGNAYSYRVIAKGYADNVSDPSNRVDVQNFLLSIDQSSVIKTYPNPVVDELFIDHLTNETNYQLCDLSGKVFDEGTTTRTAKGQKIDLSAQQTGLYLLILQTQNRTTKLKIYKQ